MTVTTLPTAHAPTAVAPARGGALSLSHMSPYEAWQFCESLANTPLLPDAYRKQPASVLWAMEYGRALGLDVVTTITTIHVIKGKPCQSADLMLGRTRSAGHRVRITSERTRCEVRIMRHDDPDDETVIEWVLDDAVTAGLCTLVDGRPRARDQKGQPQPWEKFPRAMLRARAIAEAVRIACPEVLHGAIYTPEELGAVVDQEGNPVVVERADAPPVQEGVTVVQSTPNGPPPRDFLAEAAATADAEQLAAILADAEANGAPTEYMTCLAEIRDAHAAESVGPVRALHTAAKERGAHPDHLARLAAIGATKPGAKQPDTGDEKHTARDEQGTPAGPAPHSVSDAVAAEAAIPGSVVTAEQAAAEAENALRLAASRAQLTDLDAAFERAHGLPIEQAPAATLDAFRVLIENGAAR
ncbi:RecT family protein [Streptomyces sp. YIM 121038]|uniref:recombinase RecT n=1 Tax=Streptomyces sp. YIM 121038 TaxID=2136401 RepID=UPI001110133B|nr:recombinase RecT [Streptomyces sp. YIM 121038]QCX77644.1 RecT family protein [Streptomyces sp. YIM 121038]